jgi:hypothetical protein
VPLAFTDATLTLTFSDGRTRELPRDELHALAFALQMVWPDGSSQVERERAPAAERLLSWIWPGLFEQANRPPTRDLG